MFARRFVGVSIVGSSLALALLTGVEIGRAAEPKTPTAEQSTATHKQVRTIKPAHNGGGVTLETFCLDSAGNIVACVSPTAGDQSKQSTSFIQTYTSEGELLREVPVPFKATALNVSKQGTIFVAGEGKLAKVLDGKVASVTNTPHIGDYDTFKTRVVATVKSEMAEYRMQFEEQIKQLQKQIAPLEASAKEKELSKRDQAKLQSLKQQQEQFQEQLKYFAERQDENELVRSRLVVTALAVTDEDVFVSVRSIEGHGYEVWRTNHSFEEPKKVVTQLSGCCGQLDIQAGGDRLFVAENGKFEVSVRDRDGKKLVGFGKRDRAAVDGFGSCCNPMNLRCCSNGDILAAESSIGNIKRFNAHGTFVGLIGKAKIGIGCKHVALAVDEKRNRYYMMNVDKAHIAVLVPLSEVPPETEAEKAARMAQAEFGKRLVGRWNRDGAAVAKKKSSIAGLLNSLIGAEEDDNDVNPGDPINRIEFTADGKVKIEGGFLGQFFDEQGTWESVDLTGKTLEIALMVDDAEFVNARIEVTSDDELQVRVQDYGAEEFGEAHTFRREKAVEKAKQGTAKSK